MIVLNNSEPNTWSTFSAVHNAKENCQMHDDWCIAFNGSLLWLLSSIDLTSIDPSKWKPFNNGDYLDLVIIKDEMENIKVPIINSPKLKSTCRN